jgi:hypothetical protein
MVYKATEDVVRRVMPLLDQLATRTIDKARLLQYLSARAGVKWGVLELTDEMKTGDEALGSTGVVLFVRDVATGEEHEIPYPACLPGELDGLVQAEYQRLATDQMLTTMAEPLFQALYGESHCSQCRWQGPEFAQIHRECHFAGRPVNFEPR